MRWSADLKYGFLCKDNLLYLQSALRNMICADELKNIVYKDLTEAARETMRKIVDHLESVDQKQFSKSCWACAGIAHGRRQIASTDISKSRSRIWWIPSWIRSKRRAASVFVSPRHSGRRLPHSVKTELTFFRHISAGKDSAFPLRAYGRNAQSRSGHKNAVDLQFARWTDRSTATSISLFA